MKKILSQPFPGYKGSLHALRLYAIAGCIVFVMLLLFRPFGLSRIDSAYFPLHALIYGLGTFLFASAGGIIAPLLIPSWFEEKTWTVQKELLMMVWHLCTISIVNWAITHYLYGAPPSALAGFVLYTIALGIFPVSFIILLKYITLLRRNQQKAREAEEVLFQYEEEEQAVAAQTVVFAGESMKESLELIVDQLVYITAADNYIKLHFLEGDKLTSKMMRSSLKKAEQTLADHPYCFRCHRTYLVNLHKVAHVSGNAQGLKLQVQHTDELIPVSRTQHKTLMALLGGNKQMQFTPEVQ